MLRGRKGASGLDGILVLADDHREPVLHGQAIAVGDHLGQLVAGVDVDQGEGNVAKERLAGQPQQDGRVLADGPQHAQALKGAKRLPQDVDALLLQLIEVGHCGEIRGNIGRSERTSQGENSRCQTDIRRDGRGTRRAKTSDHDASWRPRSGAAGERSSPGNVPPRHPQFGAASNSRSASFSVCFHSGSPGTAWTALRYRRTASPMRPERRK
jgi:hypothetical protein